MDLSSANGSDKRQQLIEEPTNGPAVRDRISNLPSEVLCNILSCLPTKFALATSILSKRWNNVAESLSNLDFDADLMVHHHQDDMHIYMNKMRRFVEFVNHVLFLNDGKNIERFRLSWLDDDAASYIYSWVAAVVVCNVREIDLATIQRPCIYLPQRLFGCKSLTILKLYGYFIIDLPTHVTLPNVKKLDLDSVIYLGDASFEKLISSCIVLEELRIRRKKDGDGVRVVSVLAPSLKRFSLSFRKFQDLENIQYKTCITAPNLEYLELIDDVTLDYSIDAMPLLVEARVDAQLKKMYGHIGSAKTLFFHGCSFGSLKRPVDKFLFYNVTRLELGCTERSAPWNWLIKLLGGMPNLEVLVFPEGLVMADYMRDYRRITRIKWKPAPLLPALPPCLEEVVIRDFKGTENEVDLVKYFLRQADALKQMKIYFKRGEDVTNSQMEEYMLEVERELLKYTRRSATCELFIC